MADAEITFGYIRKMENLSLKNIVRMHLTAMSFSFSLNFN